MSEGVPTVVIEGRHGCLTSAWPSCGATTSLFFFLVWWEDLDERDHSAGEFILPLSIL
jgi:hypothetical protein